MLHELMLLFLSTRFYRREERQKKHDEIRKKYGLFRKSDDSEEVEDGRYHRFDNTAVA